MSTENHYATHLAPIYEWMTGDITNAIQQFKAFVSPILPIENSALAIDLGAGTGIQSIAFSELGFEVLAVDFNQELLEKIKDKKLSNVKTKLDNIIHISNYANHNPHVISCCGDTLTHLHSLQEIELFLDNTIEALANNGFLILSFRNYSNPLIGYQRFIPVKSDSNRILTCFLEYDDTHVTVSDIVHERKNEQWNQSISSYKKVRVSPQHVINYLEERNLELIKNTCTRGIHELILQKK